MRPIDPTLTPREFIARWRDAGFGERQGAQSFFNDLCGLVGHATPAAYGDPGAFTFEKSVPGGFADAYFEDSFGWEFKGRDAQLDGAFDQLLRYQVHLKTPPLLIVSSFQTIRIQTNFPGMETARYDVSIAELEQTERLELLRDVFFAPHRFRERLRLVDVVTQETASLFQSIVVDMESRNEDPEQLARYLNQLVFCLYAEDARLLPEGLFTRIVARNFREPETFDGAIRSLFGQMATGGFSGADAIAHFNGDLFNVVDTVELSTVALQRLGEACAQNWRDIEPSIFGTLFERALDASKRAQTGAHYTGADDIKLVVEPVVMTPLRREWETVRREVSDLLNGDDGDAARERLEAFRERLASVKVLDPACGSGNFLYIALRSLLDLEREVIDFADMQGLAWTEAHGTAGPDAGAGDQPLRGGTGTDGPVDRLYPVAPSQRLPIHAASYTDPAGHDTSDRRDPRLERSRQSDGTRMAGGRVHRGEPSFFGRQAAAHRTQRRICGCTIQAVRRQGAGRGRFGVLLV